MIRNKAALVLQTDVEYTSEAYELSGKRFKQYTPIILYFVYVLRILPQVDYYICRCYYFSLIFL